MSYNMEESCSLGLGCQVGAFVGILALSPNPSNQNAQASKG